MANAFVKFDSQLIDSIFQPVTEGFEARTGINNFLLTRIILCLCSAHAVVQFVNGGNLPGALIVGSFGLGYMYVSLRLEAGTKRRHMNSFRSWPWFIVRISSVVGLTLAAIEVTTSISFLGFLSRSPTVSPGDRMISAVGLFVSMYTLACTPLPPGFTKAERIYRHSTG